MLWRNRSAVKGGGVIGMLLQYRNHYAVIRCLNLFKILDHKSNKNHLIFSRCGYAPEELHS
jgi:hypothetical protein